ncbi:V-type proton ATPase subunit E-like [Haemaphysalis longicornis]
MSDKRKKSPAGPGTAPAKPAAVTAKPAAETAKPVAETAKPAAVASAGAGEYDPEERMRFMLSYIENDAATKIREIEAKAEEEFKAEKGRLTKEQCDHISAFFKKREKQVERVRKIQGSHMKNAARLRLLSAMNDHVARVLAEAKAGLSIITTQEKRYRPFLERLILQGLLMMLEKDVVITCRSKDVKLVQDALEVASKAYTKRTNRPLNAVIDKDTCLPEASSGGVELSSMRGKFKISNTLDGRLELISRKTLPQIRTGLFGPNPDRKHFM